MQNIREMLSVYFVAGSQDFSHLDGDNAENLLNILEQALQAGITCYQFRDKGKNSLENEPEKQRELAIKCRDLCRKYAVPFFIDDNLQMALELDADGIHVGQTDMSPSEIRQLTDKPLLIGLSNNTLEEILSADKMPEVDYCGLGPVFPTNSKEKHNPAIGMAFVKQVREAGVTKPIVSIGGITAQHAPILRQNGADGVAVISAITRADDIAVAVRQLLER